MIFEQLNKMGIPYLVVRYKVSSMIDHMVGRYAYCIMVDYDVRLKRLGFANEWEIFRYRGRYMTRAMTAREIKVFKTYDYPPSHHDEHGTSWEINGKLIRYSCDLIES